MREWEARGWEPHTADAAELAPAECEAYSVAYATETDASLAWDRRVQATDEAVRRLASVKAAPTSTADLLGAAGAVAQCWAAEQAALVELWRARTTVDETARALFAATQQSFSRRRNETWNFVRRLREERTRLEGALGSEIAFCGDGQEKVPAGARASGDEPGTGVGGNHEAE